MSYLPDFDVGASKHKVPGEGDTWDVTLSLGLPVFFWQPARGEIAEADANLRALQAEATHLANAITLDVEAAFVNLTAAGDQIRLFEEDILTQAEEAYGMYQFAYEQGEIDAIDLIEARRTLNETRTSYADALFNYDVARAVIERSIGRPLQEQ
jgi:outer membrane protein TolC